jgi:transcriptional regulator with XRE-family HTH domain
MEMSSYGIPDMPIRTLTDVGAAFRQARENQNITQVQLAAKLNTTPGLISRFERGDGNIGLIKFLELLAALNLNLELELNKQEQKNAEEDYEDIDLNAIVNAGLKPSRRLSKR